MFLLSISWTNEIHLKKKYHDFDFKTIIKLNSILPKQPSSKEIAPNLHRWQHLPAIVVAIHFQYFPLTTTSQRKPVCVEFHHTRTVAQFLSHTHAPPPECTLSPLAHGRHTSTASPVLLCDTQNRSTTTLRSASPLLPTQTKTRSWVRKTAPFAAAPCFEGLHLQIKIQNIWSTRLCVGAGVLLGRVLLWFFVFFYVYAVVVVARWAFFRLFRFWFWCFIFCRFFVSFLHDSPYPLRIVSRFVILLRRRSSSLAERE